MRYLSLFSGIEAATVAWHQLGWTPVAFAEIEPGPCSVLKHHYPAVPNLGDVTCITDAQIAALGRIDVVIGGSPCQDLSVAGKRAGLAGARSSLFHEQLRIFNAARHLCGARWLVWENVPGAFSSNAGRDFAVVVGAMAGLELAPPRDGWGNEGMAVGENGLVEWCVLDAQWFGLAQRRKRVFAVLDTGDWANRPPVLLEPDRLRGDFAPRREAGQGSSVDTLGGTSSGGGWRIGADEAAAGHLIPETTHTLRADGFDASEDGTGRGTPLIPVGVMAHGQGGAEITAGGRSPTLTCNHEAPVIAFDCKSSGQSGFGVGDIASTLRSMGHADSHQNGGGHLAVAERGMQVRRLTPRECERLQGFMADYTLVPHNGKPLADGPRYKALGNSMATPVIAWIGRQIERVAQA
jgi:DNA (cytosine-5)-methyltransferase 1